MKKEISLVEVHLKSQKLVLWALLLIFGVRCAVAADKGPGSGTQPDPVLDSLNRGVDHLQGVAPASAGGLQHRDGRYHIENGDVLELQFEFTPDFNQTVTVQPDGFVTLKEIGDLRVLGQSTPEIKERIEKAYATILAKPIVTVYLRDFEKPYFLALGQVGRPGKYDLRGNTSVAAAVAMAGGLTTDAKHSQVLLFRRVNDNWSSVTKIDLKHMLQSRSLSEDSELLPGDMVYVPKNLVSKVKSYVPTPSVGTLVPLP